MSRLGRAVGALAVLLGLLAVAAMPAAVALLHRPGMPVAVLADVVISCAVAASVLPRKESGSRPEGARS